MKYVINKTDDDQVVTYFPEGEAPLTRHSDEPYFEEIVKGLLNGDESVVNLFDVAATASKEFQRITERVTVQNGWVYLDGDKIDNSLTKQVIRFIDEGRTDFEPLVLYFEKVQVNPSDNSREQLFNWLADKDVTITEEGDLILYKGVTADDLSVHSGTAVVDGDRYENRQIPNKIGSTVEMPRSSVADNPAAACSTGLHAASFNFAKTFSGTPKTLAILVNPRDVVSVPHHADKVRVCRYTVIEEVTEPYEEGVKAIRSPETAPETKTETETGSAPATLKETPKAITGGKVTVKTTAGFDAVQAASKKDDTKKEAKKSKKQKVTDEVPSARVFNKLVKTAKDKKKGVPTIAKQKGWIYQSGDKKDRNSYRKIAE